MRATTKTITVPGSTHRFRMAADLLWFASISFAAGLLAAVAAAVLVMLLAQPAYASRPAPRLVAPAAETPIVLQHLKIDSEIRDGVARTTVEMVFYNPNRRQLEGELQFPLLDGQQVTAFALDIDGKLRDAVVVEKSRGQQVFEDISRQRIDPGLLQVTEGNNFKVRVYPIFAQRTRTVSITYIENLVMLTWDADNTNVDLQVVDPNGQSAYGGGTTFQGGRLSRNFMGGYGPEEFSLRVAKPGTYRVVARYSGQQRQVVGAGPIYAHAYVYTKFGSRDQGVRAYNVMLSRVGSERVVAEITVPDKDDH